jgi:hypothetical protein
MNLKEKGLAVFGIEAVQKVLKDKSKSKIEKADQVTGSFLRQLVLAKTDINVGELREGELIMPQVLSKAPLGFAADVLDLYLTMNFLVRGMFWEAAVAKLGYNAIVRFAPDVAKYIKSRAKNKINCA